MAKGKFIVYMATAPNNKLYIGQTIRTLRERRRDHEIASRNASKSKPGCRMFYSALRKYGAENFQWKVLCRADNMDELNALEAECIARYNTLQPNGYNLLSGGGNSRHHPETIDRMATSAKRQWKNSEVRKKRSAAQKRRYEDPAEREKTAAANRNKKRSAETREKNRAAAKLRLGEKNPFFGKKHSAESIKKMSAAAKVVSANPEVSKKRSAAHRGKKLSAEHKAKIGAARRGKKQSAEAREKIRAALRGKPKTAAHIAASVLAKSRKWESSATARLDALEARFNAAATVTQAQDQPKETAGAAKRKKAEEANNPSLDF